MRYASALTHWVGEWKCMQMNSRPPRNTKQCKLSAQVLCLCITSNYARAIHLFPLVSRLTPYRGIATEFAPTVNSFDVRCTCRVQHRALCTLHAAAHAAKCSCLVTPTIFQFLSFFLWIEKWSFMQKMCWRDRICAFERIKCTRCRARWNRKTECKQYSRRKLKIE